MLQIQFIARNIILSLLILGVLVSAFSPAIVSFSSFSKAACDTLSSGEKKDFSLIDFLIFLGDQEKEEKNNEEEESTDIEITLDYIKTSSFAGVEFKNINTSLSSKVFYILNKLESTKRYLLYHQLKIDC